MRVVGPYASFGLRELVQGSATIPSNDWDFYAGAWLQTVVGARAGIFSKSIVDKNVEWNTDTISYQTPDKLQRISGDNQTGTAGDFLSLPLKVRVLDSKGASQTKVQVSFKVTAGGGSVETASMLTDQDGYAQTRWKLGSQNVIQTVEATVKKADGSLIKDAPNSLFSPGPILYAETDASPLAELLHIFEKLILTLQNLFLSDTFLIRA